MEIADLDGLSCEIPMTMEFNEAREEIEKTIAKSLGIPAMALNGDMVSYAFSFSPKEFKPFFDVELGFAFRKVLVYMQGAIRECYEFGDHLYPVTEMPTITWGEA